MNTDTPYDSIDSSSASTPNLLLFSLGAISPSSSIELIESILFSGCGWLTFYLFLDLGLEFGTFLLGLGLLFPLFIFLLFRFFSTTPYSTSPSSNPFIFKPSGSYIYWFSSSLSSISSISSLSPLSSISSFSSISSLSSFSSFSLFYPFSITTSSISSSSLESLATYLCL